MTMHWKNDHIAFQVADLDKAIAFYANVLGMDLMFRQTDPQHNEAFAYFALDGGNLELLQRLDAPPPNRPNPQPPWCPHLALKTDDLDAVVHMLKDKNIPIIKGPLQIPNRVRWLYTADPDKNIIEFVQWL